MAVDVDLPLVVCGGVLPMGVEYNFHPLQVADTKWRLGVRCTADSDRSQNERTKLRIFAASLLRAALTTHDIAQVVD